MNKKSILIVIGLVGIAIGGYALTKYLTRNVKKYKYVTLILSDSDEPIIDSDKVE